MPKDQESTTTWPDCLDPEGNEVDFTSGWSHEVCRERCYVINTPISQLNDIQKKLRRIEQTRRAGLKYNRTEQGKEQNRAKSAARRAADPATHAASVAEGGLKRKAKDESGEEMRPLSRSVNSDTGLNNRYVHLLIAARDRGLTANLFSFTRFAIQSADNVDFLQARIIKYEEFSNSAHFIDRVSLKDYVAWDTLTCTPISNKIKLYDSFRDVVMVASCVVEHAVRKRKPYYALTDFSRGTMTCSSSWPTRFAQYLHSHKKAGGTERNFAWANWEAMKAWCTGDCYYTGLHGEHGCDRLDSSIKGYWMINGKVSKNLVRCAKLPNRMKTDLDKELFVKWCVWVEKEWADKLWGWWATGCGEEECNRLLVWEARRRSMYRLIKSRVIRDITDFEGDGAPCDVLVCRSRLVQVISQLYPNCRNPLGDPNHPRVQELMTQPRQFWVRWI